MLWISVRGGRFGRLREAALTQSAVFLGGGAAGGKAPSAERGPETRFCFVFEFEIGSILGTTPYSMYLHCSAGAAGGTSRVVTSADTVACPSRSSF